jgi:hypothetical protein
MKIPCPHGEEHDKGPLCGMTVGTCRHCGKPVAECQSWGAPDRTGYPKVAAPYHTECQLLAVTNASRKP